MTRGLLLFLLMSLASYRLWRVPGLDDWPPSRALRAWLHEKVHGERGYEGPGPDAGFWREIETMVLCPWCLGFWVSCAVVAITDVTLALLGEPGVPYPALQVFAVSCAVGLIGSNLDGEE